MRSRFGRGKNMSAAPASGGQRAHLYFFFEQSMFGSSDLSKPGEIRRNAQVFFHCHRLTCLGRVAAIFVARQTKKLNWSHCFNWPVFHSNRRKFLINFSSSPKFIWELCAKPWFCTTTSISSPWKQRHAAATESTDMFWLPLSDYRFFFLNARLVYFTLLFLFKSRFMLNVIFHGPIHYIIKLLFMKTFQTNVVGISGDWIQTPDPHIHPHLILGGSDFCLTVLTERAAGPATAMCVSVSPNHVRPPQKASQPGTIHEFLPLRRLDFKVSQGWLGSNFYEFGFSVIKHFSNNVRWEMRKEVASNLITW